jgi:signal transduction histidine kinase
MTIDRQQGIMQLIYNKINDMIGAGNQLFSMQFPAQPLNYRMYQYDTSDRNSVMTKPYTVQEAEFRLSEELFDISPITAGANGEKLSVVYDTLINNFIPRLEHLAPFIKQRAGLGSFLLEDSGKKDQDGNPISRIELSTQLYHKYLTEKNEWEKDKAEKFKEFKENNDLEGYAKWHSSEGIARLENLNSLYNDAVVRGHLHEVLTILGYLNASSIAEELERSKQRMRNSARLSLDESMTVYPVQFQPNNWFKALTPNLNPQDLTMAQESIRDQYVAKQRELLRAKAELQQQMQLLSVEQKEINKLEQDIEQEKRNLNEAETKLINNYGEGVVGFAKICIKATSISQVIDVATAKNLGATNLSQDYIKKLNEAIQGISNTLNQQQKVNDAISNLTELRARKAELDSRDWKFNKANLEQRINELQIDVNNIADLLARVYKAKNVSINLTKKGYDATSKALTYEIKISSELTSGDFKLKTGDKISNSITLPVNDKSVFQTALIPLNPSSTVELNQDTSIWTLKIPSESDISLELVESELPTLSTPQTEADAEISGMFTDILLKIASSQETSQTNLDTVARSSKWGVSTWFGSAGGQSTSSSALSEQEKDFFNQEIEIGFRVAKVSFDRGGWFNPQIFKMSHAFYRLADLRISPGLSIDNIKGKDQAGLKALTEYSDKNDNNKKLKYIMPAFPVAMAIAKDITIKVKTTSEKSSNAKSVVENASSSGGGFLCFSVSSASSSKSSSESTYHGAHGEYYYIRIPGPQIIGYFLQLVPQDNSELYDPEKIKDSQAVIEALKLYHQTTNMKNLVMLETQKPQQEQANVTDTKSPTS